MPQVTLGDLAPAETEELYAVRSDSLRHGQSDVVVVAAGLATTMAAVVLALTNPGGGVLLSTSLARHDAIEGSLSAAGRCTTGVDPTRLDDLGAAVGESTQMVVVDSLTDRPELVDCNSLAEMCHSHDLFLVVDNSRLTSWVVDPEVIGATLSVCAVSDTETSVSGATYVMSLVRRHLVLADRGFHSAGDPGRDREESEAVASGLLTSHPAVSSTEVFDWSESCWASESYDHLDDLVLVRTADENPGRAAPRANVANGTGLVELRPGLLLLHSRWPNAEAGGTLAALDIGMAGAELQNPVADRAVRAFRRTRGSDVAAEHHLRQQVDIAPWASQWTSRVSVRVEAGRLLVEFLPSVLGYMRVVRPFALHIALDDTDAGLRLLAQAAASAALLGAEGAPTVTARCSAMGLGVDDERHAATTSVVAATVDAGVATHATIFCATSGATRVVLAQPSAVRGAEACVALERDDDGPRGWGVVELDTGGDGQLLCEPPWQLGGLDRGPEAGELLLAALATDFAQAAVAPLAGRGLGGWSVLIEARRELRRDAGSGAHAPLRDLATYLTVDDVDEPRSLAADLGRRWSSSPVYAVLAGAGGDGGSRPDRRRPALHRDLP